MKGMTMRIACICLCMLPAVIAARSMANAADFETVPDRFEVGHYLRVSGPIEPGDLVRFKDAAARTIIVNQGPLEVTLDSDGGDVAEAIKIGRLMRRLGVRTSVYGAISYISGTPSGDELEEEGRLFPQVRSRLRKRQPGEGSRADNVRCVSACTLLFYSGVKRIVYNGYRQGVGTQDREKIPVIGFHRPRYVREAFASLTAVGAAQAYRTLLSQVRSYLDEMGAPTSAIERMFKTESDDVDFMTADEFASYYDKQVPFFAEWLLAKCGSPKTASILTPAEADRWQQLVDEYVAEQVARRDGPEGLKSYLQNDVSPERSELHGKVRAAQREFHQCDHDVRFNRQLDWAHTIFSVSQYKEWKEKQP